MGHRVKIALAVVIGIGVVAAAVVMIAAKDDGRMPDTFVVGTVAIGDGDRALVLLRWNKGERVRSWATLVDEEGETRWITELPDLAVGARSINQGVTVAGDTVTVCYGDPDRGVVALSLDDGSERWRSTTVPADQLIGAVGDAEQVFQVYWRDGSDSYVRSLDRETGEQQWERQIDFSGWDGINLTDETLWLAPNDSGARDSGARAIARADGEDANLLQDVDASCLSRDRIWYVMRGAEGEWMLADAPAEGGQPATVRPIRWKRGTMRPDATVCGTFGGYFVFGYRADGATGIAGVVPESGEVAWEIDLGGFAPRGTSMSVRNQAAMPFRGELPRHLWFPAWLDSELTIAHLDLEQRELAHRSPPLESGPFVPSFRRDGVTYITLDEKRLLAFDGAGLSAAIEVPWELQVHPTQAGQRRVWLYRQLAYSPFEDQALAVLTAGTLERVYVRGDVEITDVTAETKRLLGL